MGLAGMQRKRSRAGKTRTLMVCKLSSEARTGWTIVNSSDLTLECIPRRPCSLQHVTSYNEVGLDKCADELFPVPSKHCTIYSIQTFILLAPNSSLQCLKYSSPNPQMPPPSYLRTTPYHDMTIFKLKSGTAPRPKLSAALFPNLPLELRELIYHHALLPDASPKSPNCKTLLASDLVFSCDLHNPSFLPELCKVNEATRIDVGLWYLRNTEFIILYTHDIVYFSQFLSTFPANEGFKALRKLDLEFFGRHRPTPGGDNAYISFMKRCPNLKHVKIKFEIWHLLKHSPNKWLEDEPAMEMLDNIESDFGLEGSFEMKRLVKLTIEVFPKTAARTSKGMGVVVPNCWPAMERVAEWIREGIRERRC
jgi:hypothetical protein